MPVTGRPCYTPCTRFHDSASVRFHQHARGESSMKLRTKAVWSLAAALCLSLLAAAPLAAQTVTTGNITGVVTDAQGGVLPGAMVTATHSDTGTSYEAVAGAVGHNCLLKLRLGLYT